MKLTYDPKYNIAYLSLKEKTSQVQTLHVSESVNIDMSPDGTIYGIELLNANEQLGKQAAKGYLSVDIAKSRKPKTNLKKRRA